jgi:hypothetical protein
MALVIFSQLRDLKPKENVMTFLLNIIARILGFRAYFVSYTKNLFL